MHDSLGRIALSRRKLKVLFRNVLSWPNGALRHSMHNQAEY